MPTPLPLPAQLERLDTTRFNRYAENLAFYEGRQWPGRARRGERRLTFNYARAFVDKVTSYLLDGLARPGRAARRRRTPPARDRAAPPSAPCARSKRRTALAQLDFETELDCAVLGDARLQGDLGRGTPAACA